MSLNIGESESNESPTTAPEDLLTHAECERILVKACGMECKLQLINYLLTPAENANGYLGEYYHLLARYNVAESDENKNLTDGRETHELRAFVKRVPQASAEAEKDAIFRKEATLYETLLERLRRYSTVAWSPRCYYTRDDFIVLEDLEEIGYALYPKVDTCIPDNYLHQVLRALAALHAASFALEHKEGVCIGNIYKQLGEEITVSERVPWYTTGLRAIRALVKSQLETQPISARESIEARFAVAVEGVYSMTNVSSHYRNVLCHRDIWRGNIFFSDSPSTTPNSVLFVDYQTARYCPPAIDLIYVLFMNLDKATRKAKETQYLRFYYDYLQRDFVANGFTQTDVPLSYSDLLASYREFQPFGLLYRAIASTILNVPREIVTNYYVQVERTDMVLKLMDELPEFRKCLEEQICEILQFLSEESC